MRSAKTSQKAEQQKGTRLISTRGKIINQQGKCTDDWLVCVISDLYLVCDLRFSSFFKQILKILTMILQHPPRPNIIIFAVSQVARLPPPHPCSPQTHSHWLASLKAIIRYLKGTADQGLTHVTPTGDLQLDLYMTPDFV